VIEDLHQETGAPLRVTRDGDAVRLAGDLDYDSAAAFRAVVRSLPAAADVVLDASAVTFVDSGGLRELIVTARDAADRGARLVIRASSAPLRELLRVTGLTSFFVVDPGPEG